MPTTCARPAYGARAAITSRSSGDSSSTSEISRATARGSPLRARATSSGYRRRVRRRSRRSRSRLRDPDDQRVALAAAAAQRSGADAAAATLQLEREVQHDAGAGHADRVAEGDRAAVDVDLVLGDAESRADSMPTAAKASLISNRSRSATSMPSLSAGLLDRVGRLQLQRRVGAGDLAGGADLGEPGRGPSSSALALLITTTAAAPSEICEAEPAVMVPSLENAGRSLASDSTVVSPRMPSSCGDHDRLALALRDLDRHDLVVEDAVLPGLGGALVRAGRERVLLLAGQAGAGGVARPRSGCPSPGR